jgi:formylglycine-generating enzyme required for sulfatase activity
MLDGYDVKDPKALRRRRGGSWDSPASDCPVVNQYKNIPTGSYTFLGFRVVLSSVP